MKHKTGTEKKMKPQPRTPALRDLKPKKDAKGASNGGRQLGGTRRLWLARLSWATARPCRAKARHVCYWSAGYDTSKEVYYPFHSSA